ncbi:hypothetical protein ACIRDV_08785, partial [Streptomyces sp. NPDC093589]
KSHKGDHRRPNGDNDERDGRRPSGGMNTGGGALAKLVTGEWDQSGDEEKSWKDEDKSEKGDKDKSWGGEHDKSWEGKKPHGGVHTGGGALALSGGSLAAGAVLMLGGLGAGAYMVRRRKASGFSAA